MPQIIALFQCIEQVLNKTTLRQLTKVVTAMLPMTGRVTMLGISRWCEQGGSYRTVQRLFNTTILWRQLNWQLIKQHLWDGETELLLAGDETFVTKSGSKTYGLDRYFSALQRRTRRGLAFFAISVVNPEKRLSSVVRLAQVSRKHSTNSRSRPKTKQPAGKSGRKGGRPKGSRSKNRRDVTLPDHLVNLQALLQEVLETLGRAVPVGYFLLDGAFGNNNAVQMTRRCGLHLISKLRCDSVLYHPFKGPQKKRGCRRKYGDRLDYSELPSSACVADTTEYGIQTQIYTFVCLHRYFADQLKVVVIVKRNLHKQQAAHVILFSSDLELGWEKIMTYYKLRFQIEFNFRDAKQFWGLEDFMNIKEQPVFNAANLALFMCNVAQALVHARADGNRSVNDLKARHRGLWYARHLLNLLPEQPDQLLINRFFAEVSSLGAIHTYDT